MTETPPGLQCQFCDQDYGHEGVCRPDRHNHPPGCCCPTDTCPVCAGTGVAAPAVGCIDVWHDEPPIIVGTCPACPDHGEIAGPYTEQETTK